MNTDQITNIITKLLIAVLAGAAGKYGFTSDLPGIAATVAPLLAGLVVWYWSHKVLAGPVQQGNVVVPTGPKPPGTGTMPLPLLVVVALVALMFTGTAWAQTNTPLGSFPATAEAYFTSFNTNYCWTNITVSMSTGYKQVAGVNAASTLDGAFYLGSHKQYNLGVAFQFSGVGSAFNAYEAQAGYELIQHYDAALELDLRGGYDNTRGAGVVEPLLLVKKKPTANTFFETGIGLPAYFKGKFNNSPTVYIETGFTY